MVSNAEFAPLGNKLETKDSSTRSTDIPNVLTFENKDRIQRVSPLVSVTVRWASASTNMSLPSPLVNPFPHQRPLCAKGLHGAKPLHKCAASDLQFNLNDFGMRGP